MECWPLMKILKFHITVDIVASFIVMLFFLSFMINQVYDNVLGSMPMILGMLGFLFIFNIKKSEIQITNVKTIIWFLLLFMFSIISIYYTKRTDILGALHLLQYFGIALLLIKYKVNEKIFLFSFYLHVLFFLSHILNNSDPNTVLFASRNMISVIMLSQVSLIYIAKNDNNKKITYLPALITFSISFWAIGRAGIISSLFLLFGLLLVTLNKENRKKNIIISGIIALLMILSLSNTYISTKFIESFSNIYEIIEKRNKEVGLGDESRAIIIEEYFNQTKLNKSSLLLGVPAKDRPISMTYSNNLHNSYLQAHAFWGLGGLVMIIFGIVAAIIYYIRCKQFLYLFIFGSLLIRISTDTVAFVGIVDPLLYYFIINGINKKR